MYKNEKTSVLDTLKGKKNNEQKKKYSIWWGRRQRQRLEQVHASKEESVDEVGDFSIDSASDQSSLEHVELGIDVLPHVEEIVVVGDGLVFSFASSPDVFWLGDVGGSCGCY